jgi:hypothetical protein
MNFPTGLMYDSVTAVLSTDSGHVQLLCGEREGDNMRWCNEGGREMQQTDAETERQM